MTLWISRRHATQPAGASFNSNSQDAPFQRDRARVIHSSAFRHLQSKTQVLGVGESDFYRTRLTHSLEVAQISSGICELLREHYHDDEHICQWLPSMSLIEAIALSHDLGHPPFGHGGEVALNRFMHQHGGFEGNGQTLRIIARLGEYSPEQGFDLTRRTLLGVLKYPCLHSEAANYSDHATHSSNIDNWIPPKCILDDEADILTWILEPFSAEEQKHFRTLTINKNKHHRTRYKSLDTSIMEIADDIAYGVHDLEDALAMGLISYPLWQKAFVEKLCTLPNNAVSDDIDFYNENLFGGLKPCKHAISRLVGFLVKHIEVIQQTEFHHPLLTYQAKLASPAAEILALLKGFVLEHVIHAPEVQAAEFRGQQMILKLFEVLSENPLRLLPKTYQQHYQTSENPPRVICDYISGLTDSQATKLYHKLFTPSMGSIFDRL